MLVDCARHLSGVEVVLFLEGSFVSFMSICEDRPSLAWQGFVTRISIDAAEYFSFPDGLSF